MMKKQPDNRLSIFEGREIAFIPSKTMLLEEGKVADRLYFIRKISQHHPAGTMAELGSVSCLGQCIVPCCHHIPCENTRGMV